MKCSIPQFIKFSGSYLAQVPLKFCLVIWKTDLWILIISFSALPIIPRLGMNVLSYLAILTGGTRYTSEIVFEAALFFFAIAPM